MSQTHINMAQLDEIAARIRVRGWPGRDAKHEWSALSEADRRFWRSEARLILAAAKVSAG